MQKLKLLLAAVLLFSSPIYAADTQQPPQRLVFQVLQEEFVFDRTTVKEAAIINQPNGKFKGLEVELTQDAAINLGRITGANIGRLVNLVLNGKIVSTTTLQTSLGSKLLITGITREEAKDFIDNL